MLVALFLCILPGPDPAEPLPADPIKCKFGAKPAREAHGQYLNRSERRR